MREDEWGKECRILPMDDELPAGFDAVLVEARRDGHVFIERFHAGWREGQERYRGENEGIFAAFLGDQFVGMAAMGVDPYAKDSTVGRLRHVFVLRAARRKGVAEALVRTCLQRGRRFDLIRLRSRSAEASRLYERLGFSPIEAKDATHLYRPRTAQD
jgi:GNAT superfamily N-acetyltransferase